MHSSAYILLGALLMAAAVSLGAIGAHVLKGKLKEDISLDDKQRTERLDIYHTAVEYQMIHSIGLLLIGMLAAQHPNRLFDLAAALIFLGIIFFSGFLYAYVVSVAEAI